MVEGRRGTYDLMSLCYGLVVLLKMLTTVGLARGSCMSLFHLGPLNVYNITQLLSSRSFHRAVHKVKRRMEGSGSAPEEGAKLELPDEDPSQTKKFLGHFFDEIKNQLRKKGN